MDKKDWNLGEGMPNVCESVMHKLNGAGWRLENGPRTILNVDSYEVTVMVWAMQEYMKKRGIKMKRLISILLAIVLLTTPVTAQTCDLRKAKTEMTAKTGIFEYKGHWYLYIGGKMQLGHIRYKGNYYYAHRTSSKLYPKGSLTKGQFRIEGKNRWYAYSINYGRMYLKNTYVRKGRFRKCIDLEIRKDHTVRYVYNNASTVRGSIRYSTAERRLQRDEGFGDWHTVEGMQFIPDGWVDFQK